ncbi:MAG: T9SS type A sorting domain-containing protein [Saprospiraceae bacterium]
MLGSTFPDSSSLMGENGELFAYQWDGLWLGINGYPAYITELHDYEIEVSPGVFEIETQVHIPAILNPDDNFEGTNIILEYTYDEEFNTKLTGINREPYLLQDGVTMVVPKQKIFLVPGDRVMLLYESFNDVTDEEFFVIDEDAIFEIETGNSDLELEYAFLEAGNYQLGYLLTDQSQNDTLIFDPMLFVVEPDAVTERFAAGGFKLFPNPSDQMIVIDHEKFTGASYDIRIVDVSGRTVYQSVATQRRTTIQTAELPSGFYVVELMSEDKKYTDKLVIRH